MKLKILYLFEINRIFYSNNIYIYILDIKLLLIPGFYIFRDFKY